MDSPDFGLLDSPWFEDCPHYRADRSMLSNMTRYLAYARSCWSHMRIAPFPPGAKVLADEPVCREIPLTKPLFWDPKWTQVGKHFVDETALHYLMKEPAAPKKQIENILLCSTKSSFDPARLHRNYRDIVTHGGFPMHQVPPTLVGLYLNTLPRVVKRWQLRTPLKSREPESVPFPFGATAGIGYTGCKGQNIDRALRKHSGMIDGFLTNGFDLDRSTPYATLCRTQVSTVDEPKHRNVAADTFHRHISDGVTASPWYEALPSNGLPCTFGYNLEDQAAVRGKLLAQKKTANVELIGDFPGFDIGKLKNRGTNSEKFLNGIRSFEIRLAIMIFAAPFKDDDTDATISLTLSQAYITFKKIAYARSLYQFTETGPSGTYWIYLLDSVICDIRLELVAVSLGDPASARVVGGDDSYSALEIASFSLEEANAPLSVLQTELSAPPKTQIRMVNDLTAPALKFHGHYVLWASPWRPDTDVIASSILLERPQDADKRLTAQRLKAIWIDAGRRPAWLYRVVVMLENELGYTVKADFQWHEVMWHAPLLLR